ncbi:hypothetical protein CPB83DRAFT_187072 [Crepidotus variabilis]|uniref:Uncharacterized protein n=1 Tax=Crepidotus variabilis TaxID=179855 RepID=A0A9P6EJD7_9AGAR|nr:hypothetical protein CPB83DRAFT_187072 [Crepidotus variabilis]
MADQQASSAHPVFFLTTCVFFGRILGFISCLTRFLSPIFKLSDWRRHSGPG